MGVVCSLLSRRSPAPRPRCAGAVSIANGSIPRSSDLKSRAGDAREWAKHPLFAVAGEQRCHQLARRVPIFEYPAGACLVEAGAVSGEVYVLLSGAGMASVSTPSGRQIVTDIFAAPALVGDAEAVLGVAAVATVITLEVSRVTAISNGAFEDILTAHPAALEMLQKSFADRLVRQAYNRALMHAPIASRLANLLLSYARVFGVQREGLITIEFRLPQAALARQLGVARRSVALVLAAWRERGWIDQQDRRFFRLDYDRLAALAATSSGTLWSRPDAIRRPAAGVPDGVGGLRVVRDDRGTAASPPE